MTREAAIKLIEYIKRVKPEVWAAVTNPSTKHDELPADWPDYIIELEGKVPWVFKPIIKAMNEEKK